MQLTPWCLNLVQLLALLYPAIFLHIILVLHISSETTSQFYRLRIAHQQNEQKRKSQCQQQRPRQRERWLWSLNVVWTTWCSRYQKFLFTDKTSIDSWVQLILAPLNIKRRRRDQHSLAMSTSKPQKLMLRMIVSHSNLILSNLNRLIFLPLLGDISLTPRLIMSNNNLLTPFPQKTTDKSKDTKQTWTKSSQEETYPDAKF